MAFKSIQVMFCNVLASRERVTTPQLLLHPFKYRQRAHSTCSSINPRRSSNDKWNNQQEIQYKKALIVSKLSRYEFEQHKHPKLNNRQLEKLLRDRGTDYDLLLNHHRRHKNYTDRVAGSLTEHGIDVRIVNRWDIILHTRKKKLVYWKKIGWIAG